MNYITVSETPDGILFIDTRVNNTIAIRFEDTGDYVYPLSSTVRHVFNVLFEEHHTNVNITWEVHK